MVTLPRPSARTRWLLAVGVTAAVVGASLVPGRFLPPESAAGGADKLAHALGSAAVAATVALALDDADRSPAVTLGAALVVAVAVGGGVELIQPLVGRDRSLADFGFDALGAVLAVVAYRLGHRWVRLAPRT
ncbi:MAG: antibiotic resistance protein VanZ [Halobacteriaceae archaeon]